MRLSVPWDVMDDRERRARMDAWLAGARAVGARPLLTFGHAPGDRRKVLPSPARLARELRRIRAHQPELREVATWNEANHCGEPTCHKPALTARYYLALRAACPGCTVLAAEVLDMPNMRSWVRSFERALPERQRRGLTWGLHNYLDANRLRTSGTRALLAATRGQIWLTETGGIVRRATVKKVTFPESVDHAAVATRWLFQRLVPLSPRITRVYLYHWSATPGASWDSALIGERGEVRPALRVLRNVLQSQRSRGTARPAERHLR